MLRRNFIVLMGSSAVSGPPPTLATPTLDLDAASDTGSSSTDNITSSTTPNFTATFDALVAGDIITMTDNGSAVNLGGTGGGHDVTSGEAAGTSIALGLSALSEGSHSLRIKRTSGTDFSAFSTPLSITVDTTAPTILTASANFPENSALAVTLTANEPVTWTKTGGADSGKFVLTLPDQLTMVAKNFESPDDADTNGAYVVQVTATDAAGNATNKTLTYTLTNVNEAPTVANTISNQSAAVSSAFSFQFNSNTFADADASDTFTYTADLSNGSALPAWLTFTPATRTFSGTPALGDVGTITVRVRDTDSGGLNVTTTFDIVVSSSNGLLTNLISYWKMDEASGNALDATASGNDLTAVNAPGATTGLINGGRSLAKASNQYFSHADNASLSVDGTSFSFAFRVKLTSNTALQALISKRDDGADAEFIIFYDGATGHQFSFWNYTTGFNNVASTFGAASTGTWYFVACVADDTAKTLKISVNAGTQDSANYTGSVPASAYQFMIGAEQLGAVADKMDGVIDEVGFWKRALSPSDITTLYNGGAGLPFGSFT